MTQNEMADTTPRNPNVYLPEVNQVHAGECTTAKKEQTLVGATRTPGGTYGSMFINTSFQSERRGAARKEEGETRENTGTTACGCFEGAADGATTQ